MPSRDPRAITAAGAETGATKAAPRWDKALVAGFLAGAYIAFAGLLSSATSWGRCSSPTSSPNKRAS